MLGQIGHFQLRRELARGAQGVVYQAHDPRLGREVALKLLERVPSFRAWQRFQNEVRSLARLVHPHIVRIHDAGQHEGQPFFVMDFVEGASLEQRLRTGPLPPREAAEQVHKLARAVDYAHRQGVLHRDIKPDNVILDLEGEPRLADFGLAKAADLETPSPLSVTGRPLGTLGYCSPEQATGELGQIARPTDVYGLGATLYAALTGQPPIRVGALDEAVVATCREPVLPPSQLAKEVPRELDAICLRCLEKDSERRYSTAGELATALQGFLRRPAVAPAPARGVSVWGPLGAALGVAALVLLGGILWRSNHPPPPSSATEPEPQLAPSGPPPVVEVPPEETSAAVEPDEGDPKGHAFVGYLIELRKRGDLDRMRSEVRAALAKDPQGLGPLCGKLELLICDGAFREAVALANQVLERDPTLSQARFNRAFALTELGRYSEGVVDYSRCLAEQFDVANVLNNRSAAYQRVGRHDLALADLDRLVELGLSGPRVPELRGVCLSNLGRHAEAFASFEAALEQSPQRADVWFQLGLASVSANEFEKAIHAYTRVLELQPRHPWANANRGMLYGYQRDFPKAIADLEAACDLVPTPEGRADIQQRLEELRSGDPKAWQSER